MINAYLIVNKPNTAAEYLEKNNILHIVKYSSSLAAQTDDAIVDVDKLLYLYYGDIKDDTAFKADLSILKNKLTSAYFTCRSFLFILVEARDDLPDYIHAALDRFGYSEDQLEIIQHNKKLMLPELSNYISGVTVGDVTQNTYINVYVTEKGREDKERYHNQVNDEIKRIVPSLVDENEMYRSRIASLSASYDTVVAQEEQEKPNMVLDEMKSRKTVHFLDTILITGDEYTHYRNAAVYLAEYFKSIGERTLVVNLCNSSISYLFEEDTNEIVSSQLWHRYLPENMITYINIKQEMYANILSNEQNIESVTTKIVVVPKNMFDVIHRIETHTMSNLYTVYVLHKKEDSFDETLKYNNIIDALVVDDLIFNEEFDIIRYKDKFSNSSCVLLPLDDEQRKTFYFDCFSSKECE